MAHLNEIVKYKETLEKERNIMLLARCRECIVGISDYEEALNIAIEVMDEKVEELKYYGW